MFFFLLKTFLSCYHLGFPWLVIMLFCKTQMSVNFDLSKYFTLLLRCIALQLCITDGHNFIYVLVEENNLIKTPTTHLYFIDAFESFGKSVSFSVKQNNQEDMRGSRKFCQKGSNSDNVFFLFL